MNRPAPVYLLLGPEAGNKSKRIREIRSLCRAYNNGEDAEIHRFYPFETEQGEILIALQNSSLFANHRLVVLAEAEKLKVNQVHMIAEYLKRPSDSATLIITSAHTSIHTAIQKAVPSGQREIFWELFENQKRDWLLDFFTTRHIDITLEAIDLLLTLVDNNTSELRTVSQQLASFISTTAAEQSDTDRIEITDDDVEKFIYHSRQESVFTLFGKIAEEELEESLDILRALRLSGETDPIQIFGGLLWQFRRLHSYISMLDEGDSETDAFKQASVLGKNTAIRAKHNQYIYRTAAEHYTLQDVQRIISHLCETDSLGRELGSVMQPILMERFIYTVIRNKGVCTRKEQTGLAVQYL